MVFVIPNACDTAIQRYISGYAMARIFNERKNRDSICRCTKENAKLQFAGRMGQLAATDWAHPTRRSQLVNLAAASCP